MSNPVNQYLTFMLGMEHFAIDVFKVREILEQAKCTKVPNTEEYIRGVINLRGNIVPVLDLRQKFGMPPTETTVDTCVIILDFELNGEMTLLGALADSVKEVLEINPEEIEPPPKFGTKVKSDMIYGICKKEGHIIIILETTKLFIEKEVEVSNGENR